MDYYKVLIDGKSPLREFPYPLPTATEPGAWLPEVAEIKWGRTGYHVTDNPMLFGALNQDAKVYLCELGRSEQLLVGLRQCAVASTLRLVAEVSDEEIRRRWIDPEVARLLAERCAVAEEYAEAFDCIWRAAYAFQRQNLPREQVRLLHRISDSDIVRRSAYESRLPRAFINPLYVLTLTGAPKMFRSAGHHLHNGAHCPLLTQGI